MTVEEFYAKLGTDYGALKQRLASEKLIKRLLGKYPNDKNYGLLCEGVKENDHEKVFTAAHTIKGVALNLGFDRLQAAASEMSEAYKKKQYDRTQEMFEKIKAAQQEVVDGISQVDLS